MPTEDPKTGWRTLQAESHTEAPRILPAGWYQSPQQFGFWFRLDGLKVMLSVEAKDGDPRKWLHVSLSREDRLPSWDDIRTVKDIFIGRHRTAIQVLPREEEYVNLNKTVLHLWCCLNDEVLPDFRRCGAL